MNFQLNELESQVYHLFNDYLKIKNQPIPKEFKQYIANIAKQNSSENKGSGAPYYGR